MRLFVTILHMEIKTVNEKAATAASLVLEIGFNRRNQFC